MILSIKIFIENRPVLKYIPTCTIIEYRYRFELDRQCAGICSMALHGGVYTIWLFFGISFSKRKKYELDVYSIFFDANG